MPKNINTIREYFDFLVNKYQNGGISGDEFSMLFNDSQLEYFSFLLGLPEQFQYGRPVPRVGIGMGKVVSKSLDPFIEIVEIQKTGLVFNKPYSFAYTLNLQTTDGDVIVPVDYQKISATLNSEVVPVESRNVYVEYADSYQVYPSTITKIKGNIVRLPREVKWNYNSDSGREVYEEAGSVHPEWHDGDIPKIMARMLIKYGIPYKEHDLVQIGSNIKNNP